MIDVRTTLDVPQWAQPPTASPQASALDNAPPTDEEREALERRRRRPFGFAQKLEAPAE
jgi:hypothetical protein